ncbi:SseB family protein [Pseudactinotalea sp.]|uniref:SseB family protein n=1 Tax=Pseudactinotalea sp. TaxID=1926260 RepID=UPI003B3AB3DD
MSGAHGPAGEGRALPPTSLFAGDDGSPPPALAAALALAGPQERLEAVVEALRTERVLVPVVARLDEMDQPGEHGIAGEKSAHAAMVTVAAPDGRAVMPVFSSMTAMQRWRAEARPVPTEGRRAALAAGTEADGVLVLDPGSEHAVQVPRPAVRAIALGEPWLPAVRHPAVRTEVHTVLTTLVPGVRTTKIEPGGRTEIVVVAYLQRHPTGVPDPETAATLRACREALATSQLIADLVDSVTVRPAITH